MDRWDLGEGERQVTYLKRELSKVWQPRRLRAKVGISPMALDLIS
jgi:hypothetical protein